MLIGEIYLPVERLVAYYGERGADGFRGAHLPFNFHLLQTEWTAPALHALIERYEAALPAGAWPNWVLGNHDKPRIAARVGEAQARVAAVLLLTLRGTPTLYQGDELGLTGEPIPADLIRDPQALREPGVAFNRDEVRQPMPWDGSANAGFTTGTPWLPLNGDWPTRNAAAEAADPASMLSLHRRLLALRRAHPALSVGAIALVPVAGDVLAYERRHGDERLFVALNLGHGEQAVTLPHGEWRLLLSTVCPEPVEGPSSPLDEERCFDKLSTNGGRGTFALPPRRSRGPRPMKIAMLAPIAWRTPPRHYGPWELVTSLLTEALVAKGVDVTLFATLDSETAGTLAGVVPAPYEEDPSIDAKVWEYRHLSHLFARAGEFDLIHNQADFPAHAFAPLVATPMVTTIHGFSSDRIMPMYKPFEDRVHYVAISDADRAPGLRYAATIHHGIRLDAFPFDPAGSEDLLFFGRMHPDKGAAESIAVTEATGRRLAMYGIVQDRAYYERAVAPHLGERVSHPGAVGGEARLRALGKAKALLHLINFDEPFGLSVIEAMACGTPVIAIDRGSMPELIEDGVTGFLVGSVEEAIEAVGRLDTIDRSACRARVAERFTVEAMADRYIDLYCRILS